MKDKINLLVRLKLENKFKNSYICISNVNQRNIMYAKLESIGAILKVDYISNEDCKYISLSYDKENERLSAYYVDTIKGLCGDVLHRPNQKYKTYKASTVTRYIYRFIREATHELSSLSFDIDKLFVYGHPKIKVYTEFFTKFYRGCIVEFNSYGEILCLANRFKKLGIRVQSISELVKHKYAELFHDGFDLHLLALTIEETKVKAESELWVVKASHLIKETYLIVEEVSKIKQ